MKFRLDSMDPSKPNYCQGPPPSTAASSGIGGDMVAPKSTSNQAQLNSGNYINVVPIPVGVQYHHQGQGHHRRKYSPQIPSDYQ